MKDSNTGLGMKVKNATHKYIPEMDYDIYNGYKQYDVLKLKNARHYYEEGNVHKSNKYQEVKIFIKAFLAAALLLGVILLILKLTGAI